jgi:serine/threonine protein kinase
LPVPDRLKAILADRYTIERELGSGGMATVYLAEDLKHLQAALAGRYAVTREIGGWRHGDRLSGPEITPRLLATALEGCRSGAPASGEGSEGPDGEVGGEGGNQR